MKIIAMPAHAGKTTELIKLAAEHFGYIVCRHNMKKTIVRMAEEMGLDIPFPLSYREFIDCLYYAPGINALLIDDVEALIQEMDVYRKVIAFTVTTDS